MLSNALIQIGLFSVVVTITSVPLGLYMARVFAGERTFLDPVLRPVERLIYRLCGVQPGTEQTWVEYTVAMLLFSVVGMVVLYALQRLQGLLPLNPARLRRRRTGFGIQHRSELYDQYQLAGLHGRIDHELPDPDGGIGLPQLRFRRRRLGNCYRGYSGLRAPQRKNPG